MIWLFMQIVSIGDNLHEMSYPVTGENKKKWLYSEIVSFPGYISIYFHFLMNSDIIIFWGKYI